jgi:hypothetical protein
MNDTLENPTISPSSDNDIKLSEAEEDLRRVVQVIASDFDGNTVAFYHSIRPNVPSIEQEPNDLTVVENKGGKLVSWE